MTREFSTATAKWKTREKAKKSVVASDRILKYNWLRSPMIYVCTLQPTDWARELLENIDGGGGGRDDNDNNDNVQTAKRVTKNQHSNGRKHEISFRRNSFRFNSR